MCGRRALPALSLGGFVLDKRDVPKGSSRFSILFHEQYAVRTTRGCQGHAVRTVLLQWTSLVTITASPTHVEWPNTLETPGWGGRQVEWRARLSGEQRMLCTVP